MLSYRILNSNENERLPARFISTNLQTVYTNLNVCKTFELSITLFMVSRNDLTEYGRKKNDNKRKICTVVGSLWKSHGGKGKTISLILSNVYLRRWLLKTIFVSSLIV